MSSSRRRPLVAVLLLLTCLAPLLAASPAVADSGSHAGGDDHDDGVDKVLVVTTPALRWIDLVEADLPNIEAFLADATTGLLSLRTIGARTGIGEGYITIGTGNRASATTASAGLALEPDEEFESGTAAQAFERRTGTTPTGELLHLGFPAIQQTNDRFNYGAEPGSLGSTLQEAGRSIGVVANGDRGLYLGRIALTPDDDEEGSPSPDDDGGDGEEAIGGGSDAPDEVVDADDEPAPPPEAGLAFVESDLGRSAALAGIDHTGQVELGRAQDLLVADADSPYGVRYDQDAVLAALDEVWTEADVTVLELSDLDRADAYRKEADPEAAEGLWQDALVRSDELFGRVLESLPDDTLVIVASPSAPRAAEALGIFGMRAGRGGGSLAQSGTTRRAGYVTLPDIAPTILRHFDIDQPNDMTGTIIAGVQDIDVDHERFALFADASDRAEFRDDATGPVSVIFVAIQIIAYGLAAVAVARRRGWVRPVSYLALVVLATPPVAFLAGAFDGHDLDLVSFIAAIFAAAVVLAAVAEGLGALAARRWPRTRATVAPLFLVSLTWLVLVVDVMTGGRLQIDTVFGYSPLVAGRFAGFGNLSFALVAVGAAVVACGAWGTYRLVAEEADGSARLRGVPAVLVGLFLAATVIVDGAPSWGSDVGGVLATVPAFTVLVLVARGVRVDWRRGVLIGLATVAVLAVFAALDLSRSEEDRTHLGRLVSRVVDDDGGGLLEVIQRKLSTNINILTSSVWTLTIPFALGLMVFLARRRRGFLSDLQQDVPGIRPMVAGGLVVAVLGFALNDSGVAVPAMMFAVLLPYLTYVLLRWDPAAR